tara:strand:+ start:142 stop:537 length:396 start_codon:yes stop_codon:yes gene_type:complete
MIEIHTDGACSRNPGPGGWAAIILGDGPKRGIHGKGPEEITTNNRMEILAVINGLRDIPEGSYVTIFSDSEYVIKTMTENWKRKKNEDFWIQLDKEVSRHKVNWKWIEAHAGNILNEEADALARKEARREI